MSPVGDLDEKAYGNTQTDNSNDDANATERKKKPTTNVEH